MQEKLYGKSLILADREMVEEKADDILIEASSSNVAFLVVGDPFGYALDTTFMSNWILFSSCHFSYCVFICHCCLLNCFEWLIVNLY